MLKKNIAKITGIVALFTIGLAISYDIGYSRCMDKIMDASECKSSAFWRQRW